MKKPLIVYVSGAPGSGKTTLATLLADQLYIPRMSVDLMQNGVWIANKDHSRKETLFNIVIPAFEYMSKQGVSFVTDHVLQKGVSEEHIIDKLRPLATVIYVHTQTADPIGRYIERTTNSTIASIAERRSGLLELAKQHQANLDKTNEPLDLGLPTIVVNTDDGYEPSVEKILEFINSNYEEN